MSAVRLARAVLALPLLVHCQLGCHHVQTGHQGQCGPALSDEQVIDVAKRALQVLFGKSALDDFTITITEEGCDYHFAAIRKDTLAAEDIFFVIDRTERVTSAPACWFLSDLGNCPTLGSSDE